MVTWLGDIAMNISGYMKCFDFSW